MLEQVQRTKHQLSNLLFLHKIRASSTMKSNFSTDTVNASSRLALLFRLIEAHDWQNIDSMFLSEPEGQKTFQYIAALVAESSSFNGMTILHACARFDPPINLVRKMIELCPEAPSSRDCLDRTPLHVAAGTGASSIVIRDLVDAYPGACMVQDKDGRSPLHMACDSSCELFDDGRSCDRPLPSHSTIAALLSASLESAVLEDKDGTNAIEYALFSNAGLQTVRLIQRAAQKVMLKNHKEERAKKASSNISTTKGIAMTAKTFTLRRSVTTAPQA